MWGPFVLSVSRRSARILREETMMLMSVKESVMSMSREAAEASLSDVRKNLAKGKKQDSSVVTRNSPVTNR